MGCRKNWRTAWKRIHQLVYIAYLSVIFHYLSINPTLLQNPPGYVLLAVTALALGGELYWYIRTSTQKGIRSFGTWYGFVLIASALVTGYLVYDRYLAPIFATSSGAAPVASEEPIEVSVERMKAFMTEHPQVRETAREPIAGMQSFTADVALRGAFQNINYMTAGDASVEEKDGVFYLVFGENFSTPDGPDLQVYLTKNTSPTKRNDLAAGVLLREAEKHDRQTSI